VSKNRISQLRKSLGLTQRALAERAGTSQQQVQRIEAGVQGVRLELATRIAAVLGVELGEIFPSLAPDRRPSGLAASKYASKRTHFLEAGLDPDPNHWTVKFFAHDGRVFSYEVPSEEKDRLEKIFSRCEDRIAVFSTNTQWVALNAKKIAATQFLFDRGVSSKDEEEEDYEVRLHLIDSEHPVIFGVEPDTIPLDDDENGSSSQLQRLFFELEAGFDEGVVAFYDEDRERVYVRMAEVLAVEAPLVCCDPALWNAQIEGQTEDDVPNKPSSHSSATDK
jgi:transcriptional regulator with XRE-family HTH domain